MHNVAWGREGIARTGAIGSVLTRSTCYHLCLQESSMFALLEGSCINSDEVKEVMMELLV